MTTFQSPNVAALVQEERRLLDKFHAKQRSLMAQDPRLTSGAAYLKAVSSMPNAYAGYCNVRHQLGLLGVAPIIDAVE